MKKIIALTVSALILIGAIFLYRDNSLTQKYYRSAEPMIAAYHENQDIFHSAIAVLSDFSHIERLYIKKDPMEYIRDDYACEYEIDKYSVLTDVSLEKAEYDKIYAAFSEIMDATDVSAFSMKVSDDQGLSISFSFYSDYGVYATLYYFEKPQNSFPYSPTYPKDIQQIDTHWYACLSTDTFMAQ